MATIALAAAGAAAGSALLPAGISVLGATISGATLGGQLGALAGSYVDQALFAPSGQARTFQGPRLQSLHVTASTEGAPVPRIYGRCRIGGQIIWATDIEEEAITTSEPPRRGKGRGGAGGGSSAATTRVDYVYYANFAVALSEGPISGVGRVWADGQELDLGGVTFRLYTGTEDQEADSLIVSNEGADSAPAYRGIAYIVFEHLPLSAYGNRIPQLSFEVHRAVDTLHETIRGVVIIPGSGEFAYATEPVTRLGEGGLRLYENMHTRQGGSDWLVSIGQLEASLPNARSASLVVSWFGTDLRAASCQIKPGVELAVKATAPHSWSVAGLSRANAHLVSHRDGRPAYGGTPSDNSVAAAITDLKARGFAVTLTPFILMDIPKDNTLSDPYTGAAGQPGYPWRGRITIDPAPGAPGSPDKTVTAAAQIASLIGTAMPDDFAIVDGTVVYNGPDEWTLRRQVLHYAWLAKAAGGIDAFVLGSELRGLTTVRSGPSDYPFVASLAAIADDVRAVLGADTAITYAADWSEYFGHQPKDGSGDVHFHLDPLWASQNIDAIAIDLYWPLSDWRDDTANVDALAGAPSIYDLDYLKANIAGGEGYDWYYVSSADREAQVRTPITDGTGKPWVYRYKDMRSWWQNQHFDRPGGIESGTPTAWIPQSKPVWLMEIGCPAVDKGANQPNVFVDPKSAESALPHFSDGRRDDLIQRRYIQALLEALDPNNPGAITGLNPTSAVYDGLMIDTSRIHVYAWDARPYPAFPNDVATWADGDNWQLGHWLNGRLAAAPLADVVATLLDDHGFPDHDSHRLEGVVTGYAVDRIMSAREALQPLELAYFFDSLESDGRIVFRHRAQDGITATLIDSDLVEIENAQSPLALTRAQESELPTAAKLAFVNASTDYRQGSAEARRLSAGSGRIAQADLSIAMSPEQAEAIAESWLYETWTAREKARFSLPPSLMALEPGDIVAITNAGRTRTFRIIEAADHGDRDIDALAIDAAIYRPATTSPRSTWAPSAPTAGQPLVDFIDLPLIRGDEAETAGYVAATQSPWPAGVAFYVSPETSGYKLAALATAPATTGLLLDALNSGPSGRIDRASRVRVRLDRGELSSVSRLALLGGANIAAIAGEAGGWELIQFEYALLTAPGTYELSGLLRAQAGTEPEMAIGAAAGSRFVLIDATVTPVALSPAETGLPLQWRYGPSDRDLGEESYATTTHVFSGLGRRPLSPAHVRARRDDGNLTITWIRRTRSGGDTWEGLDVPLAEESERYEIDVLDGTEVVRTISTQSPSAVYTLTDQIADFGTAPSTVTVRVHQLGAVWGRGTAAEAIV